MWQTSAAAHATPTIGEVLDDVNFRPDASVLGICAAMMVVVVLWLVSGLRHRFEGWRWWQVASFVAGCAAVVAGVLAPIESLGRSGSLTAHVGQHIVLGDVAAPLLLLGLPPVARAWVARHLSHLSHDPRRRSRVAAWALSPIGALVLWTLAAYAWYAPPLHRLAAAGGVPHVLDHVSFLGFGMLVWLAVFDPRERRPLRQALRHGGLPWWARHAYAMGSRAALLPPAALLWLAPGYHVASGSRPPSSLAADQASAASLLVGFEMLLFAFALVLAFIFLAVAEGQRQRAAPTP